MQRSLALQGARGRRRLVNSRQKGARGESGVCQILSEATRLQFERVPGSGCGAVKGDVHVVGKRNHHCIEVKNYAESSLTDKILTNKTNNINVWWKKLEVQAKQCGQVPLLIFKYNRSKWFVGTKVKPEKVNNFLYISALDCYIMLLDDWLANERVKWIS